MSIRRPPAPASKLVYSNKPNDAIPAASIPVSTKAMPERYATQGVVAAATPLTMPEAGPKIVPAHHAAATKSAASPMLTNVAMHAASIGSPRSCIMRSDSISLFIGKLL